MAIDLSAFSNDDLLALRNKDLSKISNQGLMLLRNSSDPTIPTPSADDGRQTRELGTFKRGINVLADVLSGGASKPYKSRVTQEEIAQESPLKVAAAIGEVPLKMTSDLASAAYAGLGTATDYLQTKDFGKVDVPFSQRFQESPLSYEPTQKGKEYYKTVTENLEALPALSQFSNLSKATSPNLTAKVNEKIQKFVNKPMEKKLKEFNLNVNTNKKYKQLSDEGYQFIPSQISNASTMDKLKESSIGTSKAAEIAKEANQKVTNKLTRKYLGVSDDTPLDFELLDRIRRQNGKVYGQIDDLPARPPVTKKVESIRDTGILDSKGKPIQVTGKANDVVIKQYRNGREILEDLKSTRYDSTAEWNYFKREGNPETRKKAILLDKKIEKLEDELIDIAKYNNKPELIPELKKARTQIAKAHLVQKALNDVSGNVDAKVISKLAYDKRLIDKNIQSVAKMYKGYKDISGVPKSIQQPPFTVLDIGLSTYGVITGNPLLAVPTVSKYQAAKYLFTPKTQQALRSSQLNQPGPEGLRGLLQLPRLTPSQKNVNAAGLSSLLAPRLPKEE